MDLLDRYVYDVGRRLPAKQREDIMKELKSLLMDALDARTGGSEPTEGDIVAVLKEHGQPADVAGRYVGEKYLIGPRLFPTYKLVLAIVLAALAFGLLVSSLVSYAFSSGSPADLWLGMLKLFGNLVSSVWGAIGIITVVFWAIERGMEKAGKGGLEEGWNPKELPPVPKRSNQWKPADSIVAIVFTVIALVLFNVYPDIISIYAQDAGGQWLRTPILAHDALAAYLPYWNIGWALSLALHAVLLAQGRWKLGTNLAHIALQVYGIAVALVMMAGPRLLSADMPQFADASASQTFHTVMTQLNAQFNWIFVIVIAACAIDIGKSIYRIIKDKA